MQRNNEDIMFVTVCLLAFGIILNMFWDGVRDSQIARLNARVQRLEEMTSNRIHKTDSGCYVISCNEQWLEGCYATKELARKAFDVDESLLLAMQEDAIETNDGVITDEIWQRHIASN